MHKTLKTLQAQSLIRIQGKKFTNDFLTGSPVVMIGTQSLGHKAGFQFHLWMWVQVPRTRQKKSVNTCQQWIGSRFCEHQYWYVFVFEGKEVPVTSPAPKIILLGQLLMHERKYTAFNLSWSFTNAHKLRREGWGREDEFQSVSVLACIWVTHNERFDAWYCSRPSRSVEDLPSHESDHYY